MEKIKYFIYATYAEYIEAGLLSCLEEKGLESEGLATNDVNDSERIPGDRDIYIIHYNDLRINKEKGINQREELQRLQEQRPESYFVILNSEGGIFRGTEKITAKKDSLITDKEMDDILISFIKNMR